MLLALLSRNQRSDMSMTIFASSLELFTGAVRGNPITPRIHSGGQGGRSRASIVQACLLVLSGCAASMTGHAVTVPYTSAFTSGGGGATDWSVSTGTLTTSQLPPGGSGSYYLNPSAANVTLSLALTGLTPSTTYSIAFDFVTIGRWRGDNGTDDRFAINYNGASPFFSQTFSTDSDLTQSYNDALTGGSNAATTGNDGLSGLPDSTPEADDYAVYFFRKFYSATTPVLSFTTPASGAGSTSGNLNFVVSGVVTSGVLADWMIGNVSVPESSAIAPLVALGVTGLGFAAVRRLRRPRGTGEAPILR